MSNQIILKRVRRIIVLYSFFFVLVFGIWQVGVLSLLYAQQRVLNVSFTSVPTQKTNTGVAGQRMQTGKFGSMVVSTPLRSTNPNTQSQQNGTVTGELLVYPNPVNWVAGAELGYKLTDNSNVTLKVFNMRAQLMGQRTISRGAIGGIVGYNRIPLSSVISQSDIPGGAYFVILMVNSKVIGRTRFVVM